MGSSVRELDRALAGVLAQLDRAAHALRVAADAWEERGSALETALSGTNEPDALHLVESHPWIIEQLAETFRAVLAVSRTITEYRATLGGSDANGAGQPPSQGPAPSRNPAASTGGPVSEGHPRSGLPRPPRPGKTHGRWFDSNGDAVMLESGRGGEFYQAARKLAVDLGLTKGIPNAEPAIARHVEIQFVARMIYNGLRSAVIEINRPVCGTTPKDQQWSDTCDRQLARFLPAGWTLTVKDGSSSAGRTYVGREVDE